MRRLAACTAVALVGCGSTPVTPGRDSGPPAPRIAQVENVAAYEGQGAFVTVLESPGPSWSGAVLTSESDALEVVSFRCGASRCGAVVRVRDTQANTGQPVPAPLDAAQAFLHVSASAGEYHGLLRIFPLDALNASGTTRAGGIHLAASVSSESDAVFRGDGSEPIRWFVFGDAEIATVDVSASGSSPGAGGFGGGLVGEDGDGPSGGTAGTESTAAGGGGAAAVACAADPFVASCGGSGGGGASGADSVGGGGGGAVAVFVLGTLQLGQALARGGDGLVGGGGGAGGEVHVSASVYANEPSGDAAGGSGAAGGGAGEDGHVRVDGRGAGPWLDLDGFEPLVAEGSVTVRGVALAGATIRVERVDTDVTVLGTADVGDDGGFEVAVAVPEGLSRLRVIEVDPYGVERRGMNGNHFEFESRDDLGVLPVGGLLDVAYIP